MEKIPKPVLEKMRLKMVIKMPNETQVGIKKISS